MCRLAKENSIFRNYRTILNQLCQRNETLYCQCTKVTNDKGVNQAEECSNRISLSVPEISLPGSFSSVCFNNKAFAGSTIGWYKPDDADVKENQRNITALRWPTPSGIDESSATNICIARLSHTSFWHVCGQLKGVNLSRTIDTCISDIKVRTYFLFIFDLEKFQFLKFL